jgi:hypothetical protein
MKRLMLALLAAAILQAVAAWADDGADAEAKYQAMLAAAKADPAAADWQALRFAYADRPSFSPFAVDDGLKAIREAREAENWWGILVAADKVLGVNYADGEAHLQSAVANAVLAKFDDAKRERAIAMAIFKSMRPNGGDGKSREQAFVVISAAEEYELMRMGQFSVVHQSLVQEAGHAYDVLEVTRPHGRSITFYFQIDRVVAAEARMLRPMQNGNLSNP